MSSKPPHVIHLVISLETGGLERMVVNLTNERNRRHPGSTEIVCLDTLGNLSREVTGDNVSYLAADRSRFPWDRSAVRSLRDRLQSCLPGDQAVVLHAHNLAPLLYGTLATVLTNADLVWTQHGENRHNLGFKSRLLARLGAKKAKHCIAVSKGTLESMVAGRGIQRAKLQLIPNGVPFAHYPDSTAGPGESLPQTMVRLRKERGVPEQAFVVGSIGRLAQVKQYDHLVSAFGMLLDATGSDGRIPFLVIVGEGSEKEALDQLVAQRGLQNRVLLPGTSDNVVAWLRCMDVFALSSSSEGLPVALLEAGAVMLPAVVTDVGACGEVVADGVSGFVVPPGDDTSMAEALGALRADHTRREKMGVAAAKIVRECYSLSATVDHYERIYCL